jgi:hypothetical protein
MLMLCSSVLTLTVWELCADRQPLAFIVVVVRSVAEKERNIHSETFSLNLCYGSLEAGGKYALIALVFL